MELPTTGLQNNLINSSSSSGVHGSKALDSLMTRVSSALDNMNSNTAAAGGSSGVSVDKVKEMYAGLAGAPLPAQNSLV